MLTHFGVEVREGKRGLKLTRGQYAVVSKKSTFPFSQGDYSDAWCEKQLAGSLDNFDLNMEFMRRLNRERFENEVSAFLKLTRTFEDKYGHVIGEFVETTDLNGLVGMIGYYLMVLDEYCQIYIGKSTDVKKRIRQHWSQSPAFDKLLFPMGAVKTSKLSIDSFRAYDTTRIYVQQTDTAGWLSDWEDDYEDVYLSMFSPEFVSNRLMGGTITLLDVLIASPKVENGVMKSRRFGELNETICEEGVEK